MRLSMILAMGGLANIPVVNGSNVNTVISHS
jgi:hypothetical protein